MRKNAQEETEKPTNPLTKNEKERQLKMNCPYCNQEMEKGIIQSPQELNWSKGEKRKIFNRSVLHRDSILLSKLSFTKGSACAAYNCSSCNKIIIDYADDRADLNK